MHADSMQCMITNIIHHPQSGVVYHFSHVCLSVCMYVCLSHDNFESLDLGSSYLFAHVVYLHGLWVKFVYEHQRVKVKVKVPGAKKVKKIPIPSM